MPQNEQPQDRAVLVAAPRRGSPDDVQTPDHIEELHRLADTAGAMGVGTLIQRVKQPTSSLYIGIGKLQELQELVREKQANLVIFDDELSPAQGKNLERELDVRVMDRTELILDIFATRARSKEARMQVELAQLEYLLPRLARMWVHLSRIRGGIGLRGPGETQLETDRRMIRRKIGTLKQRLEKVARHRETIRQGRRAIPTFALVGYTNAGKSSLLKALTKEDVFVEDRLFATLDTLTREVFVPPDRSARLIDTVGFIRKLPHNLVASFRATLEEASYADVLLHVIDVSHPDWEEHMEVVERVLADLELCDRPIVPVFNKVDLLDEPGVFIDRVTAKYDHVACTSATKGDVKQLRDVIAVLTERFHSAHARAGSR